MEYYYDASPLGSTLENTKIIFRSSSTFLIDIQRFDLSKKVWVECLDIGSKIIEGQRDIEKISKEQALGRIRELLE